MANKVKIQIKSIWGSVLFEHETEDNTIKKTVNEANLHGANLHEADLHGADLREANLHEADLHGADLRGADPNLLPVSYVNQCSKDMLYVFRALRSELPFLRERLVAGEVDGTQYEGDCACLIGSLAKAKKVSDEKVCDFIPYYDKGLHNYGEQWFWQIHEGDTPETNKFAAHALKLVDEVLAETPLAKSGGK